MNLSTKLFIFLITTSLVGCASTNGSMKETQRHSGSVIMEDVVVEKTIIRTTKQNPKPTSPDNYDIDRDFFKVFAKSLPYMIPSLITFGAR
jgi:hypothetical protein